MLSAGPIPIEVCPTSNVKTRACASYAEHPFGGWLARGYPLSVCTDDCGVFNVSLSSEYFHLAQAFRLSQRTLWDMVCAPIEFIFDAPDVRAQLRDKFAALRLASGC